VPSPTGSTKQPTASSQAVDPWGRAGDVGVSIEVEAAPASVVLADLVAQAGISATVPKLDDPVTVSFRAVPAREAISVVAQQLKRSTEFVGGVLTFPPSGRSYVTVPSAGYADPEQARSAFEALVGDTGIVKVVDGSVVVLGDDASIRRANTLAESLGRLRPARWTLCVWVVEVSEEFTRQLGMRFDYRGLFEVAAAGADAATIANVLLRATVVAEGSRSLGRVVSRGTLLVLEGSEGTLDSGVRVPVPRRTVSNFGVVTINGFDYVDAGFSLKATVTAVPDRAVRVKLTPTISSISTYIEGAPVVARRTVTTAATVATGDWLVLAGLDEAATNDAESGFFGNVRSTSASARRVFVIVNALREDGA
jgi:type II secretory pathway component GspD/PulD (secretin)